MSALCCSGDGGGSLDCLVSDAGCPAAQSELALELLDAGDEAGGLSCLPGQTPAAVYPFLSCCVEDCTGSAACDPALTLTPSCCQGQCAETWCGGTIPPQDCPPGDTVPPCGCALAINQNCMNLGQSYVGCLTDGGLAVSTAILGAASDSEWTVSPGDAIPAQDAGLADAAGALRDGGPAKGSAASETAEAPPTPHVQCDVGVGVGAAEVLQDAAGTTGGCLLVAAVLLSAAALARRPKR